jgi:hypothetical protein
MWGLEHSEQYPTAKKTVVSRIARHSYGLVVSRTWEIAEGALEKDRRRGTRGEWRADNQMHWMLRKGEKVEEGRILAKTLFQSVQVGFFDTGIQYFSDTLSYCADNSPPLRAEPSKFLR